MIESKQFLQELTTFHTLYSSLMN